MPLNSSHLKDETVKQLEKTPYHSNDDGYQSKCQIFDAKCGKCGFRLYQITFSNYAVDAGDRVVEVFSADEAASICGRDAYVSMERVCSYPGDTRIRHGKVVYPSLNEIIKNTCEFWREPKLNIPVETEFIEINTEQQLSELTRCIREGFHYKAIPQQDSSFPSR